MQRTYKHSCTFLLANLISASQDIILEPGRDYVNALISQLNSDSAVRRQGCSAALRNLCFGMQVNILRRVTRMVRYSPCNPARASRPT